MNGQVQWTIDGVLALEGQLASIVRPDITPDGLGGAIIGAVNTNLLGDNRDQVQLSNISTWGLMNGVYVYASSSEGMNKNEFRLLLTEPGSCISLWIEDRFGAMHIMYCQKSTFEPFSNLVDISIDFNFNIWPNPCVDKLYTGLAIDNTPISIYNNLGSMVLKSFTPAFIDVSELSAGIYFVKASNTVKIFEKL